MLLKFSHLGPFHETALTTRVRAKILGFEGSTIEITFISGNFYTNQARISCVISIKLCARPGYSGCNYVTPLINYACVTHTHAF